MAIQISSNNDTHDRLEAEKAQKRLRAFRVIKIGACAIAGIMIIAAGFGVAGSMGELNRISGQYDAKNQEFDALKSEAAAYKEAVESGEAGGDDDDETDKVDKSMYSAYEDGARVAELVNQAYKDGGLPLLDDSSEYKALCGNTSPLWFGETMDPEACPLEWKFLTWYDSINDGTVSKEPYEVLWGCYAQSGNNIYLLRIQYGEYRSVDRRFVFTGTYTTTYGAMYEKTGKIEDDSDSEIGQEIGDMAGQLAGEDNNSDNSDQGGQGGDTDSGDNTDEGDTGSDSDTTSSSGIAPGTPPRRNNNDNSDGGTGGTDMPSQGLDIPELI